MFQGGWGGNLACPGKAGYTDKHKYVRRPCRERYRVTEQGP